MLALLVILLVRVLMYDEADNIPSVVLAKMLVFFFFYLLSAIALVYLLAGVVTSQMLG